MDEFWTGNGANLPEIVVSWLYQRDEAIKQPFVYTHTLLSGVDDRLFADDGNGGGVDGDADESAVVDTNDVD